MSLNFGDKHSASINILDIKQFFGTSGLLPQTSLGHVLSVYSHQAYPKMYTCASPVAKMTNLTGFCCTAKW